MAAQSRLLALPRELRDTIYGYTFTNTVDVKGKAVGKHNAGLLATNKQIRHEAIKQYYKRMIFSASGSNIITTAQSVYRFTKCIPAGYCGLIETLHVHVTNIESTYHSEDVDALDVAYYRMRYTLLLDDVRMPVRNDGEFVKAEPFKALVLVWNGRENELVLSNKPHDEPRPRFGDGDSE